MQVAAFCKRQLAQPGLLPHAQMLPRVAAVTFAYKALCDVTLRVREPITEDEVIDMLSVLFDVMSKGKTDEATMRARLMVCADMLSPTDAAVGAATGLWEPVSPHPLILALAVKHLTATKIFTPAPAELRAAMKLVERRLTALRLEVSHWLRTLQVADAGLFLRDRAAWDAAYADVPSSVPLYMIDHDNEDARHLALNAMWEAKTAREKRSARLEQIRARRTQSIALSAEHE
jgi:hypothetical protein